MSNPLFSHIQEYILNNNLIAQGNKVVIGFSGGPDSMLLLHVLNHLATSLNLSLIAVHLDHGWRTNSADDVLFCKTACDKLNIPFVSTRLENLNIPPHKLKGSKEEVGRHARRFLFERIAEEHNAHLIALGQHLDDQEETFFIRLVRGSTLAGLTGIKARDGMYVRPLLCITKQDIINYLDEHKIAYLIDPTNEHDAYLRNRIRKYVIPTLRQTDDRFDHNFVRTLDTLQQTEEYLVRVTQEQYARCVIASGTHLEIDKNKLLALDPFMQNRVVIMWLIKNNVTFTLTQKFISEIVRFIMQDGSKMHRMHETWSVDKKKNILSIKK